MTELQFNVFLYVIIVFSAVFHEYMHAWMAFRLGDPTAKYAGRLTLNPLKHLDPIGTVLLPLFLLFFFNAFLGWAKPVPYNPHNLRDRKWGGTKVAFAGPAANFALALIFGLVLRFVALPGLLPTLFAMIIYINIFLGLFNLIPIPPLDGSKLVMDLFPRSTFLRALEASFVGIIIAVMLAMMIIPSLAQGIFRIIVGAPLF